MTTRASVVAFDCPHGAREILQDGKIPTLVENSDMNGLIRSFVNVLLSEDSVKPNYREAVSRFHSGESARVHRGIILGSN